MNIWCKNIFPQHLLSRLVGFFASRRLGLISYCWIRWFIKHYDVNLEEMEADLNTFKSFNAFFTRKLKSLARPVTTDPKAIAAPADGCIVEIGQIQAGQLLQAKNKLYSLRNLVLDEKLEQKFQEGSFLTAYLSPKDYHRVHMPLAGELKEMRYVPGRLFPVNSHAVQSIPHLFTQNERVITTFSTEAGWMTVIFVGALIVGGIEMAWASRLNSPLHHQTEPWIFDNESIVLNKGEEVGHFRLGSTVIILFEKNRITWDFALKANSSLKMGQKVGSIL